MKKPFIAIERREKPGPVEPKYKWLLPAIIVVAVVTLTVCVILGIASGHFFG